MNAKVQCSDSEVTPDQVRREIGPECYDGMFRAISEARGEEGCIQASRMPALIRELAQHATASIAAQRAAAHDAALEATALVD